MNICDLYIESFRYAVYMGAYTEVLEICRKFWKFVDPNAFDTRDNLFQVHRTRHKNISYFT